MTARMSFMIARPRKTQVLGPSLCWRSRPRKRAFTPGRMFCSCAKTTYGQTPVGASLAFRLQARPGEIESRQSPAPPLTGRMVISGIGVLVKLGAHIGRRLVGKRIPFQEPGHRRLVFQEALEKARKPRHSFRVVER